MTKVTYVQSKDADAFCKQVQATGGTVVKPPEHFPIFEKARIVYEEAPQEAQPEFFPYYKAWFK